MILPFYVNFEKNPLKNELMKQKSQTKSFPSNNLFTSHMVDWLFIIHLSTVLSTMKKRNTKAQTFRLS